MTNTTKRRIQEFATSQHGLVTRAQLLDAGLSRDTVDARVRTRRLRPVQRGVYRVGAASPHERVMAAVLSAPGAVASHRSAAAL